MAKPNNLADGNTPLPVKKDSRSVVLVVDDYEPHRYILSEQLRRLGYEVEQAEDGEAALELWRSGRHAFILTDLQMPTLDGFELARSVRGLEREGQRCWIVGISASDVDTEREDCLSAGMNELLAKPLSLDCLRKSFARAAQAVPGGGSCPSHGEVIDRSHTG